MRKISNLSSLFYALISDYTTVGIPYPDAVEKALKTLLFSKLYAENPKDLVEFSIGLRPASFSEVRNG